MKRLIPALLVLACVLAGCSKGKPREQAATPATVPVKVAIAHPRSISERLVANGVVVARQQVAVLPKIAGKIVELRVAEGDRVRRGQLLARLDTPELGWQLNQQRSALQTAIANQDQADDNLTRMQELASQGAISQQQLKGAETQARVTKAAVAQAKAAIRLMETQVGNGAITSPMDGVVIAKGLDLGAMAGPTTPILTIAEATRLQVKFGVAERDLALVREGAVLTVRSVSYPDEHFTATVSEIAPMVDPNTRLISVKSDLGPSARLKIGMSVQTELRGPGRQGLVVPAAAVLTDGAEQVVFVAEGTTARRVTVQLGLRDGDSVEIVRGLSDGTRVVVEGASFLRDGSPLTIAEGR